MQKTYIICERYPGSEKLRIFCSLATTRRDRRAILTGSRPSVPLPIHPWLACQGVPADPWKIQMYRTAHCNTKRSHLLEAAHIPECHHFLPTEHHRLTTCRWEPASCPLAHLFLHRDRPVVAPDGDRWFLNEQFLHAFHFLTSKRSCGGWYTNRPLFLESCRWASWLPVLSLRKIWALCMFFECFCWSCTTGYWEKVLCWDTTSRFNTWSNLLVLASVLNLSQFLILAILADIVRVCWVSVISFFPPDPTETKPYYNSQEIWTQETRFAPQHFLTSKKRNRKVFWKDRKVQTNISCTDCGSYFAHPTVARRIPSY